MADTSAQSIALSLGISALVTVACRRVRVPALLPLLLVGLALGTSGLRVIDAASLGPVLKGFITVAIGLLVFEGALHLNKEELAHAPRAVWGLLTVGAIITWAAAAAAAHLLLGISLPISILLGAALTVTGPTVVQPILRLLHVSPRLQTALGAEAVLIDPLGVVATITTLEVLRLHLLSGADLRLGGEAAWLFARPLVGGAGVGVAMGFLGYWLLRAFGRAGRPETQLLNLIAVGVCMTCVGAGEALAAEAGLAAVTICGVIMARARVLGATELRAFKELLAVMLVGTLFVLLSSRFDVARLGSLTWREGVFVLALLFAIRPVAVLASTLGSKLSVQEKIFAGTFAPRGIVALSVAAVASAELTALLAEIPAGDSARAMIADAARLELVMFVVIAGTVLAGTTLSPILAWALGVRAGKGTAVVLVGGHPLSVELAGWLARHEIECRIVDSNEARVAAAVMAGVNAVEGDATDPRWMDDVGSPHGAGWLLAWTGNHDVDQMAARWATERFGEGRAALWSVKPARGQQEQADIGQGDPITAWLDRFGDGLVRLVDAPGPAELDRVLGWVVDKRFTLNAPGTKPPDAARQPLFVGLAESARAPRTRPPAAAVAGIPAAPPAS